MRIIRHGTFDYYDSCIAYGADDTLTYVRKPEEIVIERKGGWQEFTIASSIYYERTYSSINVNFYIIGFCGTLYPIAVANNGTQTEAFYTSEEYEEFSKANNLSSYNYLGEKNMSSFFTRKVSDSKFIQLDVPVFLVRKPLYGEKGYLIIEKNPVLSKYKFFKVKDSFAAYQDIGMYLSNQLVKTPKIEDIADKYKISGHGFNELSFRHPTNLSKIKG
jgi:hypothetical protein